jgi:hypothetical protein
MTNNWTKNLLEHIERDGHERNLVAMSGVVKICLWLIFTVGLAARLSPLFDIDHRLLWQYISEDGYLMQTIARNMAIGLGMSTADGTIPTNGVQPLNTFIFAALHYIADGSKLYAIAYITIFSTLIAVLSAWLLNSLALSLLKSRPFAKDIALLSSATWFASPLIIGHSMNGLETGAYYFAIIGTLLYYFKATESFSSSLTSQTRVILGVLLGLTFLTRIDAVFFIAALLTAHVLLGESMALEKIKHRLIDATVAGIISIIIASPWLIYNKLNFGSIMPISGPAQSIDASFGSNFAMIPANLIEAAFLYTPIPRDLESAWSIFIASTLVLVGLAWMFWKLFASHNNAGKRFFVIMSIFSLCISCYYGFFFGASWFVSRYLSSLSPMLWLMSFITIYFLLIAFTKNSMSFKNAGIVLIIPLLAMTTLQSSLGFYRGNGHQHKQVVDWVSANVDAKEWVAAVQTGTLGYFHDRTINLDGKTNPEALRARINEGGVLPYVVRDLRIEYIADWAGVCDWAGSKNAEHFNEHFRVELVDTSSNLCVMRRFN